MDRRTQRSKVLFFFAAVQLRYGASRNALFRDVDKAFSLAYSARMLRVPDEIPLVYAFVAERLNAERLKRGLKPNVKPTELMRDALARPLGLPVTHEVDLAAVAAFAKEYKAPTKAPTKRARRTTKRT